MEPESTRQLMGEDCGTTKYPADVNRTWISTGITPDLESFSASSSYRPFWQSPNDRNGSSNSAGERVVSTPSSLSVTPPANAFVSSPSAQDHSEIVKDEEELHSSGILLAPVDTKPSIHNVPLPVPSLLDLWHQDITLLLWWTDQNTVSSVHHSFQLVEQILDDYESHWKDDDTISFQPSRLLDHVVAHWANVMESKLRRDNGTANSVATSSTDDSKSFYFTPSSDKMPKPRVVYELLDRQQLLSTTALYTLVEISASLVKQSASPLHAAVAEEILLDRLLPAKAREGIVEDTTFEDTYATLPLPVPSRFSDLDMPLTRPVNRVLTAWAHCARPDRAQALWNQVLAGENRLVDANTVSYNSLIAAYAKVGDGVAAEALLREWREHCESSDFEGMVQPDIWSYNTVLSAWAKSSDPDAAVHAHELLREMCDVYDSEEENDQNGSTKANQTGPLRTCIVPDLRSFNSVLRCWSRSGHPNAAQYVNQLLQDAYAYHQAGVLAQPPDSFTYTSVMSAYIKHGQPELAQQVLQEVRDLRHKEMFQQQQVIQDNDGKHNSSLQSDNKWKVPIWAVNNLMDAWSRKGDYPRVQELFDLLPILDEERVCLAGPNRASYNTLLISLLLHEADCCRQDAAEYGNQLLTELENHRVHQPDFTTYALVIQLCLLVQDSPELKARAVELVDKAFATLGKNPGGHQNANHMPPPEARRLRALILAFCKAGEAETAHDILVRVTDSGRQSNLLAPDSPSFGAVVLAWERQSEKNPRAAERAMQLMNLWHQGHREGTLPHSPDYLACKALLSCLFKVSNATESQTVAMNALRLVQDVRSQTRKQKRPFDIELSVANQLLYLLARERLPRPAHVFLRELQEDSNKKNSKCVRPNTESYNSVLWAWSRSCDKDSGIQSDGLLEQMKALNIPRTTDTYKNLIYSWTKCRSHMRTEAGARILQLQKEAGEYFGGGKTKPKEAQQS